MPTVNREKVLTKVFGDPQKRILKRFEKKVAAVNAFEDHYKKMSKTELKKQTDVLRKKLSKKGTTLMTFCQKPSQLFGKLAIAYSASALRCST